jgi:hypothetical protein
MLYRGAGIDVVWPDFAIMIALGSGLLVVALMRFKLMLVCPKSRNESI